MAIPPFSSAPGISQSSADGRYVNVSGDTMTGDLERQTPSGNKSRYKRADSLNSLSITNESSSIGGGYALQFLGTGASAYGTTTALTTSIRANTYSLSFWMKSPATTTAASFLVSVQTNSGLYSPDIDSPIQLLRSSTTGNINIRFGGSTSGSFNGPDTIFDNLWHFIVVTYDGSNIRYYSDSVLRTTFATTYVPGVPGRSYCVSMGDRGGYPLTGFIDEVHYYTNRVLTQPEISAAYNSGSGVYGTLPDTNLIAGFHFLEGTGTTSADYSGLSNNLTLHAGATWGDGKINDGLGAGNYENTILSSKDGAEFFEKGIIEVGSQDQRISLLSKTLRFFSSGIERMRISADGNVGFGTSSPDAPATFNTIASVMASFKKNDVTKFFFNENGIQAGPGTTFTIQNNSSGYQVLKVGASRVNIDPGVELTNGGAFFTNAAAAAGASGGLYTPGYGTAIGVNNGAVVLGTQGASSVKLTTQGSAGQTGDHYQVKDSSSVVIASIRNSGAARFPGVSLGIQTKTAAYGATTSDYTILCDAVSSGFTVNLPSAGSAYDTVSKTGQIVNIKKIDTTANIITIDASGSETIDGSLTQSISTPWMNLTIQSNGTSWFII